MKVFIHNQDIINVTEADTIVLPVDGSGPGLEGNTARRFMKHLGIEHMYQTYAPPPYYPFETYWSNVAGNGESHFEWLCCVDTLSHKGGADHKANLRKILRSAFKEMLGGGVGRRLASPILTGGKRIPIVDAIYIMMEEATNFDSSDQLHIAEIDAERFKVLQQIVR